jgi:hypothetical protein
LQHLSEKLEGKRLAQKLRRANPSPLLARQHPDPPRARLSHPKVSREQMPFMQYRGVEFRGKSSTLRLPDPIVLEQRESPSGKVFTNKEF